MTFCCIPLEKKHILVWKKKRCFASKMHQCIFENMPAKVLTSYSDSRRWGLIFIHHLFPLSWHDQKISEVDWFELLWTVHRGEETVDAELKNQQQWEWVIAVVGKLRLRKTKTVFSPLLKLVWAPPPPLFFFRGRIPLSSHPFHFYC